MMFAASCPEMRNNMKENIVLYITGLHSTGSDDDSVEMIYAGKHYFRNGKHFIKYQESLEDGLLTDNMIKISPKEVELVKKGPMTTNMLFTIGEKNLSYYDTPFGSMTMGIDTSDMCITENDGEMNVDIHYNLEMNGNHVAKSHVVIKVREETQE